MFISFPLGHCAFFNLCNYGSEQAIIAAEFLFNSSRLLLNHIWRGSFKHVLIVPL